MDTEKILPLEFSSTSLQDFVECPRRFELSNLDKAHWPAAHSSPLSKFETLTEIGTRFHHLCQQYFAGVDPDLIENSIGDPDILKLWRNFVPYGEALLDFPLFFEEIIRVPFENDYLVAKFDLLVQKPDHSYLIIDWKTAKSKPPRTALANRMQTFLYPYMFQQVGGELFGAGPIQPAKITMQYWYPLASDPAEVFPYSETKHQEVSTYLHEQRAQIQDLIALDKPFPLTEDHLQCKYCRFRSFCERGFQASPLPAGAEIENEDLSSTHFDLDLIQEIEF